jgi:hypothetical protein
MDPVQAGEGLLNTGDTVPATHAVDVKCLLFHDAPSGCENSIPPLPISASPRDRPRETVDAFEHFFGEKETEELPAPEAKPPA